MGLLECPMCDFTVRPTDDYILQLHFEQVHTPDSPFIIQDDPEPLPPSLPPRPPSKSKHTDQDTPASGEKEGTVPCPVPDCRELVLLADFDDHLNYHAAETLSFDESTGKYHSRRSSSTMALVAAQDPHSGLSRNTLENNFSTDLLKSLKRSDHYERSSRKPRRNRSNTSSSGKSIISRSIVCFNPFAKPEKVVKPPTKSARLGRDELGPHAWESQMPKWLHDQLAAGPEIVTVNRIGRDGRLIKQEQVQNESPGIIPILAQLSALDRGVREAYYCHPSTIHIGKTPKEGGFCGYRNIQMLISYIQGARAQGCEEFPGRTPGVLKLQDLIETAWDKGINTVGRIQTGGIRGTRKYIGTPEAQAFFLSSEINCAVQSFSENKERRIYAHDVLLDAIERYFSQNAVSDGSSVYKTLLPPIYFQEPGHSLTIVGFERRRDGSRNLMVFDPMYNTSPAMHKLLGRKNIKTDRPEIMFSYRRVAKQLEKHAAFEILLLMAPPPLFPAWDVLRQFPDCRFVYSFFRSRTLGYDVYPEDHFLPNFPWQQYAGLWSTDDARFARAQPLNPITTQALRRITGEGASPRSSNSGIPISPLASDSFHCLPAANVHILKQTQDPLLSYVSSFDGQASGIVNMIQRQESGPVYDIGARLTALYQPRVTEPNLSLLTEVSRKYPGFPTPLSPTPGAKELFPSPASETGSRIGTPRALSPVIRPGSPMSVDGSEMCGPSHRCISHGYSHYASPMGLIDSILHKTHTQTGCVSPPQICSPPRAPSLYSLSPTTPNSPPRAICPRTATQKNTLGKSSPSNSTPTCVFPPAPGLTSNARTKLTQLTGSQPPSIQIANGTETDIVSPISSSGTMLLYTSNRTIDSGLLAVKALSETQVAEYRFWMPCGRRTCAFGCGATHEGEVAAAKRLFKGVEEVCVGLDEMDAEGKGMRGDDGLDDSVVVEEEKKEVKLLNPRAEVGRSIVTDWERFLMERERVGVAKF